MNKLHNFTSRNNFYNVGRLSLGSYYPSLTSSSVSNKKYAYLRTVSMSSINKSPPCLTDHFLSDYSRHSIPSNFPCILPTFRVHRPLGVSGTKRRRRREGSIHLTNGKLFYSTSFPPYLSNIEPSPPKRSFGMQLLNFFGYKGNVKRVTSSEILLQCALAQAGKKRFFREGKISDSFRAKHALIVLHAWIIHKRLLLEGDEGKLIQESLFDSLWEESTHRIRAIGVNELSVNSYLKEIQQYSYGAMISYDAAINIKDDPEKRKDDLAGALYRYVYLRSEDENLDEAHVLLLADYVENELESLLGIPFDAIREGRIKWGSLPKWKPLDGNSKRKVKGAVNDTSEEDFEDDLRDNLERQGDWRTAYHPDGRPYYWNVKTRETTWEKPF